MRRRKFIALLSGAATIWPLAARAQRATMPVIGLLGNTTSDEYAYLIAAFRNGLTEAGYVEGRNVTIEYRWADDRSERLPMLAADLVSRHVDVIMTSGGTAPAVAAKAATPTIPIVFAFGSDPVKTGLVASINRPGGNITGVSFITTALAAKRLELLRELLPKAAVIGVLVNPKNLQAKEISEDLQDASRTLGLKIHLVPVSSIRDFESAFVTLAGQRVDALLIAPNQLFNAGRRKLVALASRHALPTIFIQRQFVADGGLLSYGPSLTDSYRQAGNYVGRILKGAKPADLPVLLPTKYELVINLKTAKALGLAVPLHLQQRADEVIE
jgi:ABC-type uncharacterized transport system substrate-binding protein